MTAKFLPHTEYPLPIEKEKITDAIKDLKYLEDKLERHKHEILPAKEFYRKANLSLESLISNLYDIKDPAPLGGIQAEFVELLDGLGIYYESPKGRTYRMRRMLFSIIRKEKVISWHQLDDKYEWLFHTLCDYFHAGEALEQLKEEKVITETYITAFDIQIPTNPIYEFVLWKE